MIDSDTLPPDLEFVPLQNAMLCVDCESVTGTPHDTCPVCGSHSLLGLARLLGGTLAAHKASNCTTSSRSGVAKPLLFNAEVVVGLNRISAAEFSAIIGGITSVMTPALEKDRASLHVEVEPFSKRRPARQERVA